MDADQTPTSTAIPLWLDCDPGHDDAFAILLAAHHPSLRLLGLSTVHGNASLKQTTWNALSILTAIGRQDVPVHPGAAKPFCREVAYARDIHGKTGLDGTAHLPEPKATAIDRPNAVLAMRHAILSEPKDSAWIVATGTLTNVALLFAIFPEVVEHIKGLSIMGGAIGGGFTAAPMGKIAGEGEPFGNWTSWAEFNIYCDPEAAQAIFSNVDLAARTTLVPLDLTHQVLATEQIRKEILYATAQGHSIIGELFHDLLVFFAQTYKDVFGLAIGPPLHDPIAVAVILDGLGPDCVNFKDPSNERWHVTVVTDGRHSEITTETGQLGRTIIKSADPGEGGVRIPRWMDKERFWSVIKQCLELAEETVAAQ